MRIGLPRSPTRYRMTSVRLADLAAADAVESLALEAGAERIAIRDALEQLALATDVGLTQATEEPAARHRQLGQLYPFDLGPNLDSLVCVRPNGTYSDLLRISRSSEPATATEFEQIAPSWIGHIFGERGRVRVFGTGDTRGGFVQRLEGLQDELQIPRRYPEAHESARDAGLDAIVWLELGRGISSTSVVLLVQVTTAPSLATLLSKSGDIDARRWSWWLNLRLGPVTALASPRWSTEHARRRLETRALVFDRPILTRLASGGW